MIKKLLALSNHLYATGNYTRCRKILKKIIRLKPNHPTPYYILALIEEEKDKERAYNLYKLTAVLKKNDIQMYKMLYELIDEIDKNKIQNENFILKEKIFIISKIIKHKKDNNLIDELNTLLVKYLVIIKNTNEYNQYLLKYIIHRIDNYSIEEDIMDRIEELKEMGAKIIIKKLYKQIIKSNKDELIIGNKINGLKCNYGITSNISNRIILYFFRNKEYSRIIKVLEHFNYLFPIEFMLIYFICGVVKEENTYEYMKEERKVQYKDVLLEVLYNCNSHTNSINIMSIGLEDLKNIKDIEDIFIEELKESEFFECLLEYYKAECIKYNESNSIIADVLISNNVLSDGVTVDNNTSNNSESLNGFISSRKEKNLVSFVKLLYYLQCSNRYLLQSTILLGDLFYYIEDYNNSLIYYLKAYKIEQLSGLKIIINNIKQKIKNDKEIINTLINYNYKNINAKSVGDKSKLKYSKKECVEVRNTYCSAMAYYSALIGNDKVDEDYNDVNTTNFLKTAKILIEDLISNELIANNDKFIKNNVTNLSVLHGLYIDEWHNLIIKVLSILITKDCNKDSIYRKDSSNYLINTENLLTILLEIYIFRINRRHIISIVFYTLKYSIINNNYKLYILGVKKLLTVFNTSAINLLYYSTNIFNYKNDREYNIYIKSVQRYILRTINRTSIGYNDNKEIISDSNDNKDYDINEYNTINYSVTNNLTTLNNILLLCTYLPNSIYPSTVLFLDNFYKNYYNDIDNKEINDPIGGILLSSIFISHSKSRKVVDRKYCIRRGLGILKKIIKLYSNSEDGIEKKEENSKSMYNETVLLIYYNLGRSYQFLGLFSLAEECYFRSLDSKNLELFLLSYHNLRIIYKDNKTLLNVLYNEYKNKISQWS